MTAVPTAIGQPRTGYVHTYSATHPVVARVEVGQAVEVETVDAFGNALESERDLPSHLRGYPYVNPQTGPVHIEGAKPGDTLVVRLQAIKPTRDHAVTALVEEFGLLTSTGTTATLQRPLPEQTRLLPIEPSPEVPRQVRLGPDLVVPWRPFLGTIGVAPLLEAPSSLTCGPWGGNLDLPDIGPGAEIHLAVHHPGALFFTGDAHACQGDGEITGVAGEIPARVTMTFDLIPAGDRPAPAWPRILTDTEWIAVGCARPFEDACRIACRELVRWIAADTGLAEIDAYHLLGQAVRLRPGNLVNPNYSVAAAIDRRLLPAPVAPTGTRP